jgi:hypothetical protein
MTCKSFFVFCTISFIHFFIWRLSAQEIEADTLKALIPVNKETGDSVCFLPEVGCSTGLSLYLELLGKSWLSVNLDYRWNKRNAASLGLNAEAGLWPSVMYYHFFGQRSRFEIGGGSSCIISFIDGLEGISVHGIVGYRYQKKKGLLFRIGFTPFYAVGLTETGRSLFVPFGGISFGYSF